MSDLATLLADAHAAARPATIPPYESLVRRRRRRDLRTRALGGLGVLVLAGGATILVPALTDRDDRALPPAEGTQDWRQELLADVELGVAAQFAPLQGSSFSFLLSEGFTDEVDYQDRAPVGSLLDGPVTLTAHRGDQTACLRAVAVGGVLTWAEPMTGACADRERSVVDLEFELVGPASERFADNPMIEDGELRR